MLLLPVAKSPIVVPSSEVERGYIGEHATSLSILISPSFMGLPADLVVCFGRASVGRSVENVNESFFSMKLCVVLAAIAGSARHPVVRNIITKSTALSDVSDIGDALILRMALAYRFPSRE